MTKLEIKETLEKQLQLLSECSGSKYADDLAQTSEAMVKIVTLLLSLTSDSDSAA